MADWTSAGLPVGLFILGTTVFGVLRRKSGHAQARKSYPSVARELGIEHRPSRYREGLGTLVGDFEGRRVVVDPDDQRAILVRFRGEPEIELTTYEARVPPRLGQRDFRFDDRQLRARLKTSRASSLLEARLRHSEALAALLPLLDHRQLSSFAVTASGIVARFDYGSPPYIPAPVVRETVPLLVRLAAVVDGDLAPREDDGPERPAPSSSSDALDA